MVATVDTAAERAHAPAGNLPTAGEVGHGPGGVVATELAGSSILVARTGVLERAGQTHLVEYLHFEGERVGYMRHIAELGRWRWMIADAVGDEATRAMAQRIASYFYASQVWGKRTTSSWRQTSPSSRRPGSGPNVGISYQSGDVGAEWRARWATQGPLCPHALVPARCGACGEWTCAHPGVLAHLCEVRP